MRDEADQNTSQLREVLEEAKRVTAKVSEASVDQAIEKIRQHIRSETTQIEEDILACSDKAKKQIGGLANSSISPLVDALESHESSVVQIENTMAKLADKLENSSENIAERTAELEERMDQFREEVREARSFLETSIEEKKKELEEERSAFRSTLSKAKELFGS